MQRLDRVMKRTKVAGAELERSGELELTSDSECPLGEFKFSITLVGSRL
jgi:hypothetical protein